MGYVAAALNDGERRFLTSFLEWLREDRVSVHENDRAVHADFRSESREDRKKRLRPLREAKKRGLLSESNQQILDLHERTSIYFNKFISKGQLKQVGQKTSNFEENKRLLVLELGYRTLHPEEPHYSAFEKRTNQFGEPTRAYEMRLRKFEHDYILTGKLTLRQICEEQLERFRAALVLELQKDAWAQIRSLPISERVVLTMQLRLQFHRTAKERAVLDELSQMSLTNRQPTSA